MAGTVFPIGRRERLNIAPSTADTRPRQDQGPRDGDRNTDGISPSLNLAGSMANTFWELMADLSEADRWQYRYDTQTGELYVEDAKTLKRYFNRLR